jgi:cyclic pyranopterin phosphate synthase
MTGSQLIFNHSSICEPGHVARIKCPALHFFVVERGYGSMVNSQKQARELGDVKMIDVGEKPVVERVAIASGEIVLQPATIEKIKQGTLEKGNVVVVSKIAGISAAKKTPDMLPLCHPLRLTKIEVDVVVKPDRVVVTSEVKASERTGVEMEALVATTAALLNVWDMTKMYEKDADGQYPSTAITNIHVVKKTKGTMVTPGGN